MSAGESVSSLPQPGEPTMDLLHPEVRGLGEGLLWLLRQWWADHFGSPVEGGDR